MTEEVTVFTDLDYEHMPLSMEACGVSYCDGSYIMTRNCATQTVIEYVIKGTGTIETPHGIFHPNAGDTYILRSNEPHRYYSDAADPWTKVWVNLQGLLISPTLDAYGIHQSMLLPGLNTKKFITNIHQLANSGLDTDQMMHECCKVFLDLCQFLKKNRTPATKQINAPKNIVLLKEYLDTHLQEQLTLDKCAEIAYLSVSQTIRSFRSAYGMTPYEYLNQRRINTAKLLLCNTSLSVDEIAVRTGFPDHNYFSKYFKKKVGISPSKFRKSDGMPR